MSKKVLYLGGGKWCWTESCSKHAAVIESKNKLIQGIINKDKEQISNASAELQKTPEGVSTYRYLVTQQIKNELGRNPNIGLDFDGTTGDFTHQLREHRGTSLKIPKEEWLSKLPNPDDYAMWKGSTPWYDSREEFLSHFKEAEVNGIYTKIPVYPNASKVLTELKNYGFTIKGITAREAVFNVDTKSWIKSNSIPVSKIINPGMAKETVKDIDVYLDDAPQVIKSLLDNEKKVVIMNHEYNQNSGFNHPNSRRVDGWSEKVIENIFELVVDKKNKK